MKSQTSTRTNPDVRYRSHAKGRRRHSGRTRRMALFTILPAFASAAAVWALLDATAPDAPAPTPALGDATVQLVGQVVAVSPESITTRSSDGTTTTFQITPATTQFNSDGGTNSATGTPFTINETVSVMGVLKNGTPVATALADQSAGGGPPMDAV